MAFTLDTYAHVMPGMQPECAELFDALFFDRRRPHQEELEDPRGTMTVIRDRATANALNSMTRTPL